MTVFEFLDITALQQTLDLATDAWQAGLLTLPGLTRRGRTWPGRAWPGRARPGRARPGRTRPDKVEYTPLVQERPGFHLGIAADSRAVGRDAARLLNETYQAWLDDKPDPRDTEFRNCHFTIAVGGGNTIKRQYRALLKYHFHEIDWLEHVRFFFLEESCRPAPWERSYDGLVDAFLQPLAKKLIRQHGPRELRKRLGLSPRARQKILIAELVDRLTYAIDIAPIRQSLDNNDLGKARALARAEATRYQQLLKTLLGEELRFHIIISGVGKDGSLGALTPYTAELFMKKPAVVALQNDVNRISIALNRGIVTAADCVSLVVSGSHKLRALGRFEMDDSAGFEQTVLETPIRMLRETRETAERVYIFADDRALLFEEDVFQYQENGQTVEIKSEVREGDEPGGIHILLVHGFMGLYTYVNLLIRLPRAWQVSALRRGKHAKNLPDSEVFPQYAKDLRKIILHNWRQGRPTPICCHSMAGLISDHLLLSVLSDYGDELPDFNRLKKQDRQLIEALRAAGIIHIATWSPTDVGHFMHNFENRKKDQRRRRSKSVPPTEIYLAADDGSLQLKDEVVDGMMSMPAPMGKIINYPATEKVINALNLGVRQLLGRVNLQKMMGNRNAPYGQRLLGRRVLAKVSFYGVLKEMNAAMHQPVEYQQRHLKALQALVKYDIPYLGIVHRDDALVSADRHIREFEYLLDACRDRAPVKGKTESPVPMEFLLLQDEEPPTDDMINAHFVIMSTTMEGGGNARRVTGAMTSFVHNNIERSIARGTIARGTIARGANARGATRPPATGSNA